MEAPRLRNSLFEALLPGFLIAVGLISSILPDVNILMNRVKDSQANLKDKTGDIDKQVERLKRQIAEARDLASRVKVGVNFDPNTFVEIKNPDDLAKQSVTTKISGYFKTDQPNGALVYVGNEMGTSRKLKRAQTVSTLSLSLGLMACCRSSM